MKFAKCPECGSLHGPLANDLLTHLRDEHGIKVVRYGASDGRYEQITGFGGLPFRQYKQLEFVEADESDQHTGQRPE